MKFGIFDHVDCSGVSIRDHLENRLKIVEAYDRAGFHGYHVAEHHSTPLGFAPSPGIYVSAVAQRTSRMKIGPLVFLLPLYEPLRLIEEICMLDHMSGGRLMLGVGRGASPFELALYGVKMSDTQAMYDEAFKCIMHGLHNETLSFEGKYYKYEDVPMLLKPLQTPHPELWYGVQHPDSTAWAAANDVNIVTLALNEGARQVTDRYRKEWRALGKSETDIPLMGVSRHIVVAETDKIAKDRARRAYARWVASFEKLWKDRGTSVRELVPAIGALFPTSWDELEAIGNGCAGTPETVRRYVQNEVAATGINYIVSWFAFGDLSVGEAVESANLFSRHVMPAFA